MLISQNWTRKQGVLRIMHFWLLFWKRDQLSGPCYNSFDISKLILQGPLISYNRHSRKGWYNFLLSASSALNEEKMRLNNRIKQYGSCLTIYTYILPWVTSQPQQDTSYSFQQQTTFHDNRSGESLPQPLQQPRK